MRDDVQYFTSPSPTPDHDDLVWEIENPEGIVEEDEDEEEDEEDDDDSDDDDDDEDDEDKDDE